MSRLWVLALNDGEAVAIRDLLEGRGERVLVSSQRWGASWAKLEPAILEELSRSAGAEVYGIELQGAALCGGRNIDHHYYRGDDRSNRLSSLEQVAEILGVELDRHQQLVAANDRGYIPAMEAMGATTEEVLRIRQLDRRAQGITGEQERQAEMDVAAAEWNGKRVEVWCPEGITSAHSDLLYSRAEEALLRAPDQWQYEGPRHMEFVRARFPEQVWSGGRPESGYFGVEAPGAETRERMITLFRQPG